MKTLKIPVISGKDSLSSTYRGDDGTVIKIPPVLCISVFGKIPDVAKTTSADFKKVGSTICLVGAMDFTAMAGSIYFDILQTPRMVTEGLLRGGRIPHVNLALLPKTLDLIHAAIQKGKILSCHDISEGGLLTTIFEMCVGGNMGAELHLGGVHPATSEGDHPDFFLFNETAGSFIVEVEDEKTAKNLFKNIPFAIVGKTKKDKTITVSQNKTKLFDADIDKLKQAWQKPMKEIFG